MCRLGWRLKSENSNKKGYPHDSPSYKKISSLNFRSETEIIEAYEINQRLKRIDSIKRGEKFRELTELFDLKENCPFDELTVKQAEQERLLWKLVDLERGQHE